MKLIIGLGNPEKQYELTRHNVGHQVIDFLSVKKHLSLQHFPKLSSHLASIGQGIDDKIFIGYTDEYMNNSGRAIKKIADYYKILPQDIYVIHDDLDLPVGEYKLQFDRGAAGHNGIKSTVQYLGTPAFHRVRVGIDHPRNSNRFLPVEDYVLMPLTPDEKVLIKQTIDKILIDLDKLIG